MPGTRRRCAAYRAARFVAGSVASVLVAAPPAIAQESWRLADALALLTPAHPRTIAAHAAGRAASARASTTATLPDPQLQFAWMNYEVPGLRPMPGIGMAQIQLMQMIPLGGRLRSAGRAASERALTLAEQVNDAVADTRARTTFAFLDLYVAEQSLAVLNATARLLDETTGIAARFYEIGSGRQADVLRAQVEVARLREEIARTEAMRAIARSTLNAVLARDNASPVGAPRVPLYPATTAPLDSLLRLASAARPLIRAAERAVSAASLEADAARRELWPDLQVGVQYGQRPGNERMASLMLGVSLPVFASRRQYPQREAAGAELVAAKAELAWMRAETQGEVATTHAALVRARRLTELYRSSILPQAEATVASALAAYQSGTGDIAALLDAQRLVLRLRLDLVALIGDEGTRWAELERLVGHSLLDPSSEQPMPAAGGTFE